MEVGVPPFFKEGCFEIPHNPRVDLFFFMTREHSEGFKAAFFHLLNKLIFSFARGSCNVYNYCERFEPRSDFISRLSMIVQVNVVLDRTVFIDSD